MKENQYNNKFNPFNYEATILARSVYQNKKLATELEKEIALKHIIWLVEHGYFDDLRYSQQSATKR